MGTQFNTGKTKSMNSSIDSNLNDSDNPRVVGLATLLHRWGFDSNEPIHIHDPYTKKSYREQLVKYIVQRLFSTSFDEYVYHKDFTHLLNIIAASFYAHFCLSLMPVLSQSGSKSRNTKFYKDAARRTVQTLLGKEKIKLKEHNLKRSESKYWSDIDALDSVEDRCVYVIMSDVIHTIRDNQLYGESKETTVKNKLSEFVKVIVTLPDNLNQTLDHYKTCYKYGNFISVPEGKAHEGRQLSICSNESRIYSCYTFFSITEKNMPEYDYWWFANLAGRSSPCLWSCQNNPLPVHSDKITATLIQIEQEMKREPTEGGADSLVTVEVKNGTLITFKTGSHLSIFKLDNKHAHLFCQLAKNVISIKKRKCTERKDIGFDITRNTEALGST